MQIAKSSGGDRIVALPGESAICPTCDEKVVAKCGEIKVWHWAHEANSDCDPWSEPESEWHIGWKSLFPEPFREVVLPPHRADIKTDTGVVLELQHSALSPAEIYDREKFYGDMIWIIDSEPFIKNLSLEVLKGYVKITWKWFRKSWVGSKKPIFIDMRDGYLFQPVKLNDRGRGYGHFVPAADILHEMNAFKFITPMLDLRRCPACFRNGVVPIANCTNYEEHYCQICKKYLRSYVMGGKPQVVSDRRLPFEPPPSPYRWAK